ncbi:eukaryotic membrane protein family-domain-containing protein [Mrakia frigida]|uniref:Emp65p n=1 Tax=Mrakia frigida TaxID=29902 RepID=UPI003FCC0EB5
MASPNSNKPKMDRRLSSFGTDSLLIPQGSPSTNKVRSYPSPTPSPPPQSFPSLRNSPSLSSPFLPQQALPPTPLHIPIPSSSFTPSTYSTTSSPAQTPSSYPHVLGHRASFASAYSSFEQSPSFIPPSSSFPLPSAFSRPSPSSPTSSSTSSSSRSSRAGGGVRRRHRPPAAYSSLPPSPTRAFLSLDSPELDLETLRRKFGGSEGTRLPQTTNLKDQETWVDAEEEIRSPSTFWEYLQEEIWANDFDSHQEMKWERVSNFLQVPLAIEKLVLFGSLVCLDSFLYVFTILPLRALIAFFVLGRNYWVSKFYKATRKRIAPSQKIDMLKFSLLLFSCAILITCTDASYMYHSIRGQDSIKLVVIFNAFEIADRLCCAFGQDLLDSLFARETLSRRQNGSQPHFRPAVFFFLNLVYVVVHALVLLYQLISLNVAVNSYDYALLTLLVSNQFAEIKGSVFKKFEKENLFQIACADIVERFQLSLMLTVIAVRNLIEMSGSDFAFLPKSFIKGKGNVETILSPAMIVLGSEMAVDWVKHAYITKFNHIRSSVYERFTDVLCRDLVTAGARGVPTKKKHVFADQSPLVSRRLGFAALPLACLVIRVAMQAVGMASRRVEGIDVDAEGDVWMSENVKWVLIWLGGLACWACLVAIKIALGISILNFASRRFVGMDARREEDDEINDFERAPLGEGEDERQYNKRLTALLDRDRDDMRVLDEIRSGRGGEEEVLQQQQPDGNAKGKKGKKKKLTIEEVSRWTMVKRIF